MTRIVVMKARDSDTLSLAEIKARLSEIVDRIESRHERITGAAAVLISPDDLATLEDTLELLSDPQALSEITRAREEIARGEGITADELRSKYLN